MIAKTPTLRIAERLAQVVHKSWWKFHLAQEGAQISADGDEGVAYFEMTGPSGQKYRVMVREI